MYRQGPPAAPFVPASQQAPRSNAPSANSRSSRAVAIVSPSLNASPDVKQKSFSSAAAASASPSKAALSAKAAGAAVFVPKGASTPKLFNAAQAPLAADKEFDDGKAPTHLMNEMSIGEQHRHEHAHGNAQPLHHHVQSYNPYLGTDSGRGTPTSFGLGGYDTDGSSNIFDPTYMGPLPNSQQQQQPQLSAHEGAQGIRNAASAQGRGAEGSNQASRAFNPYEHLNEYGEPTNTGRLGNMSGPGMDFYAGSSQHNAAAMKIRQPLQYHLYHPSMPHVSNLHPQHLSTNAFFMSGEEREELQRKNEALQAGVPPAELGGPKLPEELHVYHSLVPLEPSPLPGMPGNSVVPQLVDPNLVPPNQPGTVNLLSGASGEASRVFGYRCHVYKAQCTLDGKYYVLRRLENFRLTHEAAIALVERWRRIRHPSIVSVREAFTTRAFGDSSIVFVYDYHPLAATLYAEHMVAKPPQPDRRTGRLQAKSMQVPERTLWTYLCQLTNVVRTIHQHGLAARCIDPSKVIRTGKNRIRLNCCSIFDVIAYDPNATQSTLQAQQKEDLANMGKLILSLACNSIAAVQNIQRSLDQVGQAYSADLKNVIVWLISPSQKEPLPVIDGYGSNTRVSTNSTVSSDESHRRSSSGSETSKDVEQLQRMLGVKFAEEFDSALNYNDLLESSLSKELENARLVRLLCKFGFINERPEFDHDPRWSETGDRYIVKLFRDYVFHAVDGAGRPVVDLSHILTNLNKLDAGSLEKIMLTSRDEQSCLVVSYREIKNCIDSAFADLSRPR